MFEKPSSPEVSCIALEGNSLKAVQLSLVKNQPVIEKFIKIQEISHEISQHKEHAILKQALENRLIVSILKSSDVLVRTLHVKLKKESDIAATLPFQAETLLPFPIEDALIDHMIVSKQEEGSQLTILAVRKELLQQHLQSFESIGIEPELTTCEPAALTAFGATFISTDKPYFMINLGYTHTTCLLVQNGALTAVQTGNHGLQTIETICKQHYSEESLKNIDFLNENNSFSHLFEAAKSWKLEIARLIHALSKQKRTHEIFEVVFTGEGTALTNFTAYLNTELNKKILEPNSIPSATSFQLQYDALSIGAALSALPKWQHPINFRQKEFVFPNPFKRYFKTLLTYAGACLFLAVAILFLSNVYASYQEDILKQEYVDLLHSMNYSHDTFEKEYALKQLKQTEPQVLNALDLTKEQIENRLIYLHKGLKSSPNLFPFLPNVPRVSDVLAWLSTHPILVGEGQAPLQIEQFTYAMVKRPEPKKPQEKYQIKVEMEFSSPIPKVAREFHDALIAPNNIVDPKGEVKWSSNKGKYKTSFYLKDKTAYPTLSAKGEG